MKQHFITFAGSRTPNSDIHKAGARICNQAKKLNLFDSIKCYTEEDLKSDTFFWKKHENFINLHKRGYGFWLWKPYIIKKYMENINEGDILVYCDSGCEILNIEPLDTILSIFSGLKSNNILMFTHDLKTHIDCHTKQVCYSFFNVTENNFLQSNLYFQANRIFLIKNKASVDLVDEWWNVMSNNYFTFDNSIVLEFPEKSTFKESRHDQTILNFVLLKHNMLSSANNVGNSSKNAAKIFVAARNKTGKSKYK